MKKSRLKRLLAALLGRGSEKNQGDVWHKCPFCKHPKNKLSINILSEKWHCWHCNAKGRKLFVLFRKVNESLVGSDKYVKGNSGHPNKEGSKMWAEHLIKVIDELE